MSKSAEAFRTISEVADELGVPKHVLRFWEIKFAHIRPMKRGGGRRLYRPEDMALLCGIRHLLHREGYTIKGVQKILREQGVDAVKQRGDGHSQDTAGPAKGAGRQRASEERVRRRGIGTGGPSRGRTHEPAAGKKEKGLLAAIAELEACRALLSGTASGNARRRRGDAA
jgi:DNA-binding transcriptional MerR regulator